MLYSRPSARRNSNRHGRSTLALAVLIACTLALVAAPAVAAAASSYGWDGGHDALGWAEPSGTAYFAEGTTRNGFEEYLLLRNPGGDNAVVTIHYLFPSGSPQTQDIVINPWAGAAICVNDVVGPEKDVSVAIEAAPGIVAERQIYFNYKTVWTGGSAARGVESPRDAWYFAEGTTRAGFQQWLCLQNPSGHDMEAKLTYMLGTGETREQKVTLKANSRYTADVNAAVGPEQDVSTKVTAAEPFVAERPMYFDYKNTWRGGHTATGAADLSTDWYVAEGTTRNGFEEWLCIMNPGVDTTARVEYLFAGGAPVVKEYPLKAHSRTTVSVNEAVGPEKDVSISVTAGSDVMCERPMYFCYHNAWEGGHDVVGATESSRVWYFPTASTGTAFESWLCVANPGTTQNKVLFEVYGDGGDYNSQEVTMPPRTRATFDVNVASADIRNPWLKVTGTSEVVAERPAYFSYAPKIDPQPFTIATWGGIEIKSPIKYSECLGPQFHEASNEGNNCPAMQPIGTCLRNDNPGHGVPGVAFNAGNDPYYFVEDTRSRGTYSTTACDVQAKAGTTVYAPVNGVVVVAEPYMLYGAYPDLRVRIRIDGHPDYQMAILHMSQLLVSVGQRVEAGKTPIGIVRDLVPYFNSGPNPYTRNDGNHAHIQINYKPEQATGLGFPPSPTDVND
jgi:hypothetical protein